MDAMFRAPSIKSHQLRSLITNFRALVTALNITFKEHGNIDEINQFSIYAFSSKADKGTRMYWECELERRQKIRTFDVFIKFMERRRDAYEKAMASSATKSNTSASRVEGSVMVNEMRQSNYCNSNKYATHACEKFSKLDLEERS